MWRNKYNWMLLYLEFFFLLECWPWFQKWIGCCKYSKSETMNIETSPQKQQEEKKHSTERKYLIMATYQILVPEQMDMKGACLATENSLDHNRETTKLQQYCIKGKKKKRKNKSRQTISSNGKRLPHAPTASGYASSRLRWPMTNPRSIPKFFFHLTKQCHLWQVAFQHFLIKNMEKQWISVLANCTNCLTHFKAAVICDRVIIWMKIMGT